MNRRSFLAGIIPALFMAKALSEIIAEDKPKYIVVYDPCNPQPGMIYEEAGSLVDIIKMEKPSYGQKTGVITYTCGLWCISGPLPKKYQK